MKKFDEFLNEDAELNETSMVDHPYLKKAVNILKRMQFDNMNDEKLIRDIIYKIDQAKDKTSILQTMLNGSNDAQSSKSSRNPFDSDDVANQIMDICLGDFNSNYKSSGYKDDPDEFNAKLFDVINKWVSSNNVSDFRFVYTTEDETLDLSFADSKCEVDGYLYDEFIDNYDRNVPRKKIITGTNKRYVKLNSDMIVICMGDDSDEDVFYYLAFWKE